MALEAAWYLLSVKVMLQRYAFNVLTHRYGLEPADTDDEGEAENSETLRRIGWAIGRMARMVPWNSVCLDQALSAQRMLARRRMSGLLCLGVAKKEGENGGLKAHAWVRCGSLVITGRAGHEAFTVVSRLTWDTTDPERRRGVEK